MRPLGAGYLPKGHVEPEFKVPHIATKLDVFILAQAFVLLFRRDGVYSVENVSSPRVQAD